MAKKKPLTEDKKETSQEFVVNLKIKKITDDTDKTVKAGVREIRKVVFENVNDGVSLSLKEPKASHFLRKWDKRIFTAETEIVMTLTVPYVNQKLITDFGEEDGED